jgi:hypothetical protein
MVGGDGEDQALIVLTVERRNVESSELVLLPSRRAGEDVLSRLVYECTGAITEARWWDLLRFDVAVACLPYGAYEVSLRNSAPMPMKEVKTVAGCCWRRRTKVEMKFKSEFALTCLFEIQPNVEATRSVLARVIAVTCKSFTCHMYSKLLILTY